MKNIYELVTNRILEELEKGVVPWHKPWTGTAKAWSHTTGRPYSLLNQLLLPSGEYITFKQCQAEGGKINKGAKGRQVIFWKPYKVEEVNQETGEKEKKTIPLLRYYTVFHITDTDLEQKHNREEIEKHNEPIEELENIKTEYLAREKVNFNQAQSNSACYSPGTDTVTVPLLEQFDSIEEYYSTAFHELAHSTGHATRLNRLNTLAHFGSEDYSKEELIAELTASAVLCSTGIETDQTFKSSASYIDGWKNAIRNDNKLIIHASSKAQKAYELIMGEQGE